MVSRPVNYGWSWLSPDQLPMVIDGISWSSDHLPMVYNCTEFCPILKHETVLDPADPHEVPDALAVLLQVRLGTACCCPAAQEQQFPKDRSTTRVALEAPQQLERNRWPIK